jgi:hypothetical protein
MLIPRFTIRWLLSLTTVSAVFFLIVTCAVQGDAWAVAVSLGVASLAIAFLVYGVLFGVAWLIASAVGVFRAAPSGRTPFATTEPPPQIVPPGEPEQA